MAAAVKQRSLKTGKATAPFDPRFEASLTPAIQLIY
jgi:hypothetical protein